MPYSHVLTNPQFWKTFITPDRCSCDQIPDLFGNVATVTGANLGLELNLNGLRKGHESALTILGQKTAFTYLVSNSGIMASPFAMSANGIDQQFAVNHLGAVAHEASVPQGVGFETLNDESFSDNMTRQYVHAASHGSLRIRLRNLSRNIYD
ncbi:hypothetical protein CPC16_001161 [Podila verticillata]|nr:hypothetical protein CPC16_001161 [Podila verticillata]